MPRKLTSRSAVETLKREAKRWLRALRAGDAHARARLEQSLTNRPEAPTLRDVQHALAIEHGLPGWDALRAQFEDDAFSGARRDELIGRFLENACPDHHVRGGPGHLRARSTSMRLLARFPDIARANLYTMIVCGDIENVERILNEHPDLATRQSAKPSAEQVGVGNADDLYRNMGPKGWVPLSFVCFTRLPTPQANGNAVAIARLLLDRGADPNAYFMAGSSKYTPLVGAIGEGEEDRPPHPRRDELVQLLLERGANPYDNQVVYNIGFHGDLQWFLEAAYARSLELGRKADWDDPEWSMLDMGPYGSGARWNLEIAIKKNDTRLAEWCLSHGASPNAPPAKDDRRPKQTLYEGAVRLGRTEIAELLARHGARRVDVVLSEREAFAAACFRLDRDDVRARLAVSPMLAGDTAAIFLATRENRADVVELLLDAGVSPDVENNRKERPLHIAGYHNAIDVAKLLIARGAEIDPVESNWSNTPLGCAVYYQHLEMIDLLSKYSRDVWELTFSGYLDRLQDVLREEPNLARGASEGRTPLMWLPTQDESRAIETARLLIENGADASLSTKDGITAADRAERIGMFDLAEMLREAADAA